MDYQDLLRMKEKLSSVIEKKPRIGIVLGSGLSYLQKDIVVEKTVDYADIPGHPICTNKSHKGQYLFGTWKNVPMAILNGRLHYFEGYESQECVIPQRLLALLGVEAVILTNAIGGITSGPGSVQVNTDQITALVPSPLRGKNIDELGTRFPDMSHVYDLQATKEILEEGRKRNLPCVEGVFMQFPGPQFETPAEIQMAKVLGATGVGMSTGIEAIALRHMGVKVVALSLVTNWAAGISKAPLDDAEVLETATKSEKTMTSLFEIAMEVLTR